VGSNNDGTRTFWTIAIPDNDVSVQFGAGKGEMNVNNLAIEDYHFLANAIGPNFDNDTADDPAVVSFDVVWSPPITRRVSVTDGTLGNNYAGEYVENQVTVTWSGTNQATGFSFTSNPGTFATSFFDGGFAELGHEHNGSFFDSSPRDTGASAKADAVLTQALATSTTPAAKTSNAPLAPPIAAELSANPATGSQGVQAAPSPVQPLAGAVHARVIDYLFTDLSSGLSDTL
jgi:hypothetical protein